MNTRDIDSRPTETGRHAVGFVTYLIALVAWIVLVADWLPPIGGPTGMEMGMGQSMMRMAGPGAPEAMALSNGLLGIALYLVMWGVMMVGMMYPSATATFRGYDRSLQTASKSVRTIEVAVFVGTYTVVWSLVGLVPLAVNAVVPIASLAADGAGSLLLAIALLTVSLYQFSRTKRRHLRHCRVPHYFASDERTGIRHAVRSGLQFGADSVGCCWALMGLVVVVGSMNVLWMAVVTVLVTAELLVPAGKRVANVIGVLTGFSGVVLLVDVLV